MFGVHSAIDWTWFVPAVAITGLFCAGWVAGRGPIAPTAAGRAAGTPAPARLQSARARAARPGRAGAPVRSSSPALAAVAVAQPWRADHEGDEALACSSEGDFAGARAAADRATTSTRCRSSPTSSRP